MITPVILLITGCIFFIVAEYVYLYPSMIYLKYGVQGMYTVIILGAVLNVLTKSAKYSSFDSSKEMLYTVLDHEVKTKGKAVAITGNKAGKGLSALLLSVVILPIFGSYESAGMIMFGIFLVGIVLWISFVFNLDNEYNKRVVRISEEDDKKKGLL